MNVVHSSAAVEREQTTISLSATVSIPDCAEYFCFVPVVL